MKFQLSFPRLAHTHLTFCLRSKLVIGWQSLGKGMYACTYSTINVSLAQNFDSVENCKFSSIDLKLV